MSRKNRSRTYRTERPAAQQPQLTVVQNEPPAPAPVEAEEQLQGETKVIEMRLLVKHMPAFNRWLADDSEENLVALFEVMYPGAGELEAEEYPAVLEAFRVEMDRYIKEMQKRGKLPARVQKRA